MPRVSTCLCCAGFLLVCNGADPLGTTGTIQDHPAACVPNRWASNARWWPASNSVNPGLATSQNNHIFLDSWFLQRGLDSDMSISHCIDVGFVCSIKKLELKPTSCDCAAEPHACWSAWTSTCKVTLSTNRLCYVEVLKGFFFKVSKGTSATPKSAKEFWDRSPEDNRKRDKFHLLTLVTSKFKA